MIQPDLKYCPKCRDEYYPHAESCGTCGIKLVLGKDLETPQKKRRETVAIADGDNEFVPIHKAALAEIRRLQNVLKGEHIDSMVTSEEKSGCGSNCGKSCGGSKEFYLQVRKVDLQDTFEILEKDYNQNTGLTGRDNGLHHNAVFDPQAKEAICPACGERFSTASTECPECGLCFA